ncbi:MAG: type II toxin-antitoxin system HicA family toxin [Candidatus Altiarchaeota archaeon]|nr:type II toxin-antitoxin system HicA family toxin [Candidatus Altiarchaeota archaeon]
MVSGKDLLKLLKKLGYEILRQRGSHVRLRKITSLGEHNITVPLHDELSKGTLNDILSKVSLWNSTQKEELIKMLK